MNWNFFATLYTGINTPVDDFVNVVVGALTGYLTPILRTLIVVYVAGMALVAAMNPGQEPLGDFLRQLFRAALVFFVVSSAANFNEYFGTVFLKTLPTEISNAISGAAGTHVVTGGAFDTVWNKAWTAGLVVYKNLPWSIKGIALELLVVVYWFVAITTIGIGFLIFLGAHVTLALVIALGPLFICCFLFPATRRFFDGWVGASVSLILTQILSITLLSLLIDTENATIAQIAANNGGDNEIAQLQLLLYAVVLFTLCALLASQLPGIAVGIAGGVHQQIGVYSQVIYGGASAAGRGAARRTASAAGRTASAVAGAVRAAGNIGSPRSRRYVPPGPSLSEDR
jgi:type IV secretion system protein VirB6